MEDNNNELLDEYFPELDESLKKLTVYPERSKMTFSVVGRSYAYDNSLLARVTEYKEENV